MEMGMDSPDEEDVEEFPGEVLRCGVLCVVRE